MKKSLSSKRINALSIILDGAFTVSCIFAVVCVCMLLSLSIVTHNQTGVVGFQLTPNNSGFPDAVVNLVGLFSDRVFEARRTTFVSDAYLEIELACSLITSVLAAAAIFFASRPIHRAAFGQQFFSKKNAGSFGVAAVILLVMAAAPAILESILIANGDNLRGLYSINGAVLAVIMFFISLLTASGTDLLPQSEKSVEDEDSVSSGKTTSLSKLGQNSRALSSVLWIAVIVIAVAAVWVIISLIPILPYTFADVRINQDGGQSAVLAVMLGSVDEMEYTPLALVIRYVWELAVLVLAEIAVIKGIKILSCTKRVDTAFEAKTEKLFVSCAVLVLLCSVVGLAGSVVSWLLTGVRFNVPLCGFICAAALFACSVLINKLGKLKQEHDNRKLELEDDLSDLSFVLR